MKRVTITINKQRVLECIDALTFKRVDGVMADQAEQVRNALSSDSTESLDKSLLHNYMEGRDAELRARLAFCLVSEDDECLSFSNDSLSEELSFVYELNAPDHYNKDTLKALTQKIHKYFIDGVAYDWYSRQGIAHSVGAVELDAMLTDIVVSLRKPFVRRPLQPFGPAI